MPNKLELLLSAPTRARRFYAKEGFDGLTPRAMQALIAIELAGNPSVKEVADRMSVSERAAGDVVRTLQRLGLVQAQADPTDKRRQRQRLTDLGSETVLRFGDELGGWESDDVAAASPSDIAPLDRRDLRARFEALPGLETAVSGKAAEEFVALLFRRAHFRVDVDPGGGVPRQVDLVASRGSELYVVEVKARARPIGQPELDDLRVRLANFSGDAVGVLVSFSGFTQSLQKNLSEHRSPPVLLLGPGELASLSAEPLDLTAVLAGKRDQLTRQGLVVGDSDLAASLSAGVRGPEDDEVWMIDSSGQKVDWVQVGGEFGLFSFAGSHDSLGAERGWVQGLQLDLRVDVLNQEQLLNCFRDLEEFGLFTSNGCWCIQQARVNWHGVGIDGLRAALAGFAERYHELDDFHYREEVFYSDTNHLGAYVLAFDVSADEDRAVWYARISMHLPGVPLEMHDYRELARTVGDDQTSFLRTSRHQESGRIFQPRDQTRGHAPIATIVGRSRAPSDERLFVRGVVLPNPLHGAADVILPEGAPQQLLTSAAVVADIRGWHPVGHGPATYHVTDIEWASLSEGPVIRVRADWDEAN